MHLIFVWVLTRMHSYIPLCYKDGLSPQYHGWGIPKYPQFIKYRADETMRLKTTNLNIKKAEMKRKPSNLWRILNLCVLSFLNKFHNHFSNRAWPFYMRKVSAIWYLSYSCIWQFTVQSLHYNVKGITLLSNCVELQKWWKDEIVKRKLKNRSLSTYLFKISNALGEIVSRFTWTDMMVLFVSSSLCMPIERRKVLPLQACC